MPEQRNSTADAYQALFDLMANRRIRIQMEGELGDVEVTVLVRDGVLPDDRWIETASVFAQDNPAEALEKLHRLGALSIPD